jgi:hypothetical protein
MKRQKRIAIPLADYERIFRVIYSVLDGQADIHQACIFFALVGAAILETQYKIKATPIAGAAAVNVNSASRSVSVFGLFEGAEFQSSENAFHCWVEAEGIAIDFMAPLYEKSLQAYGAKISVPARMFQKPITEMAPSPRELLQEGEFFLQANPDLSKVLFHRFSQRHTTTDLANVCMTWFRRPPKPLPGMCMRDDLGKTYPLKLSGPQITGVW